MNRMGLWHQEQGVASGLTTTDWQDRTGGGSHFQTVKGGPRTRKAVPTRV